MALTLRAEQAIEIAKGEAGKGGRPHAGPEHLLLALTSQDDTIAAQILSERGITYETVGLLVARAHAKAEQAEWIARHRREPAEPVREGKDVEDVIQGDRVAQEKRRLTEQAEWMARHRREPTKEPVRDVEDVIADVFEKFSRASAALSVFLRKP